jgi:hypothetical protein
VLGVPINHLRIYNLVRWADIVSVLSTHSRASLRWLPADMWNQPGGPGAVLV